MDLRIEKWLNQRLFRDLETLLNSSLMQAKVKQSRELLESSCMFFKRAGRKQVAMINNLQPKRIFGVESNVVILVAEDEATISSVVPERPVKIGTK
jgi:hypothetical protein